MALTGSLLDAPDGKYRLSTEIGIIEVEVDKMLCIGTGCPLESLVFDPDSDVTLTSVDGTVNIAGKIEDLDDGHYVLRTDLLGTMRISADMVECSGEGCPRSPASVSAASVTPAATPAAATPAAAPASAPPESAPPDPAPNAVPVSAELDVDPSEAQVRFAGSDTVGLGLMPYLLEDYADYLDATAQKADLSDTETYVRYVDAAGEEITSLFVNSTGSGDAADGLEAGTADLGMTSRPMEDDEAARLIAAGAGDARGTSNETVIAVDSLAVITHPDNPVRELTLAEIAAMYLGQIDNWSQVGGPDAPITVLSREDGSSTRGVFENAVFSGAEPTLGSRITYPGGDNPEMAAAVREDPNAIGYVGFAYSEGLNRLNLASECGIISSATPFSVKTEEYPLGRRLYLYNRADNLPEDARQFLDYVLSAAADDAIAQSDFVNFAVEHVPQSRSRINTLLNGVEVEEEFRLADQLRRDLADWDRLSTTVRFPTGSWGLGPKETNDIERLISFLEAQPSGTRVAVVGFADSIGPFGENEQLSSRRAEAVANAISSRAGARLPNVAFETRAYSELAPAVCNTDENGRTINRRVEVWLHK